MPVESDLRMNKNIKVLLGLLSDGVFHSGSDLGEKLGLTRGAIWKLMKQLSKYGVKIEARTNQGYRIAGGLELLDKKIIIQSISAKYKAFVDRLVILDEISSTNAYLAELIKTKTKNSNICFAESQSAGKGRLGRMWVSPYARNIYLSLLWDFTKEPSEISGLSLTIAVAVAEALKSYGIKKDITLKWPNDVLWQKRKLAGILIETYGEAHNICHAIIGVGLNVNMPQEASQAIDQPWCSVAQIISAAPQRNKLAGLLLDELLAAIITFQDSGLKPFLKKWHGLDAAYRKKVTIITPNQQKVSGVGWGVNDKGYFLLKDSSNKIRHFAVGEVSLQLSVSRV
jgi:BirA family biotin operon repressor/biotin-[acetyl-CoA-carboxylase] ligase